MAIKTLIFLFCTLFLIVNSSFAGPDSHIYSTWDVQEVDSCASGWLIKNFVDKQARFKFYPNGEIITEGTAFDTPDAELRRKDNMSTFETIVDKFKVSDQAIKKIASIIHDIEVNYWGKKVTAEAEELSETIREIISTSKSNEESFSKSFKIFDELYAKEKQ